MSEPPLTIHQKPTCDVQEDGRASERARHEPELNRKPTFERPVSFVVCGVQSRKQSLETQALTVLAWLTVTGGCFKLATRRRAAPSLAGGKEAAAEKSEPTVEPTGD